MPNTDLYWLDDPEVPYATFLSIIHAYLQAEVNDLESLQEDANRPDMPLMVTFKQQFREVIANPKVLPEDALFTAAEYDDGTDEAFLNRLWRELYGDESPTADQKASPSSGE